MTQTHDLTLEIDGASQGNPGPAGLGVVVRDHSGHVIDEINEFLGHLTNNQAEYQALLRGLREVVKRGAQKVLVKSDSELLVRQMLGIYKVKDAKLQPLVQEARRLMAGRKVDFTHVERARNRKADSLATRAIDQVVKPSAPAPASAPASASTPAPAPEAPASAPGYTRIEDDSDSIPSHEEEQISAGGVVYRKEGTQFKICLIAKKKQRVWALPKGRVDPGETPEQTAVREVHEETGLLTEVKGLVDQIDYHFYWRENETLYHKMVYFYLMAPVGGELSPNDPEADLARWFSVGDAYRQLTYLNEKEILRKAQRLLEAS